MPEQYGPTEWNAMKAEIERLRNGAVEDHFAMRELIIALEAALEGKFDRAGMVRAQHALVVAKRITAIDVLE